MVVVERYPPVPRDTSLGTTDAHVLSYVPGTHCIINTIGDLELSNLQGSRYFEAYCICT